MRDYAGKSAVALLLTTALFKRLLVCIFPAYKVAKAHSTATAFDGLPVVVINLDRRTDRLEATLAELERADFTSHRRFAAFETPDGRIGCSQSHIAVLEDFIKNGGDALVVCEDDVTFVGPGVILKQTVRDFLEDPVLDILCIGNNVRYKPIRWSALLNLSSDTQTTSCYVVKRRAARVLLRNFKRGQFLLSTWPNDPRFAIDIYWKHLQWGRLVFCVPSTRLAIQRPSFSDIEKAWVDYEV